MEQKNTAPDEPPPRELTSWKEIAEYLGVNVRTAQKWEGERALPIRRQAGRRGRVSADTASIDAWKERLSHAETRTDQYFSWPLGPGLTVEIRFVGTDLKPAHIELLDRYLDILKTALL